MIQSTGQRIRELREQHGLTQLELGRLLYEGLSKNAQQLRVSRLEKSHSLKSKTLGKVANALACSIADLQPIELPEHHQGQTSTSGHAVHLSEELVAMVPNLAQRVELLNALPGLVPDLYGALADTFRQWAYEMEAKRKIHDTRPAEIPHIPRRNGSDGGPSE